VAAEPSRSTSTSISSSGSESLPLKLTPPIDYAQSSLWRPSSIPTSVIPDSPRPSELRVLPTAKTAASTSNHSNAPDTKCVPAVLAPPVTYFESALVWCLGPIRSCCIVWRANSTAAVCCGLSWLLQSVVIVSLEIVIILIITIIEHTDQKHPTQDYKQPLN
jgi:hypothetical protein